MGAQLLERHIPPKREEAHQADSLAFLPKAIEAVRVWDALLDAPQAPDARETDRILAASLPELALTAPRQDLSEERRQEIYALIRS
ncbi:MAG: hypothetical protein OXF26_10730 [Alphaproteobacteria bacterium]|nr:hypothetical protein [Alphaproteobacteria bacterium]